jgi:hypothetical protein
MKFDLHGLKFCSVANTPNGQVGAETVFHYGQNGNVVTATYSGGGITKGQILAKVLESGQLDMRYHHLTEDGEFMLGKCISTPERLSDGRLRFNEEWQWLSGTSRPGNLQLRKFDNGEPAFRSTDLENDRR